MWRLWAATSKAYRWAEKKRSSKQNFQKEKDNWYEYCSGVITWFTFNISGRKKKKLWRRILFSTSKSVMYGHFRMQLETDNADDGKSSWVMTTISSTGCRIPCLVVKTQKSTNASWWKQYLYYHNQNLYFPPNIEHPPKNACTKATSTSKSHCWNAEAYVPCLRH